MATKKPAVGLRKPPASVDPAVADRFVHGASPSPPLAPAVRRTRAVIRRKDGRELRRLTIYLPPDLARRLGVYAASTDTDVSDAVAAITGAFLASWTP